MHWYYWVFAAFAYVMFAFSAGRFSLKVWRRKISTGFWSRFLFPGCSFLGLVGNNEKLKELASADEFHPLVVVTWVSAEAERSVGYEWVTVFLLPVRCLWSVLIWGGLWVVTSASKLSRLPGAIFHRLSSATPPLLSAPAKPPFEEIQGLKTVYLSLGSNIERLEELAKDKTLSREKLLEQIGELEKERIRIQQELEHKILALDGAPSHDGYRDPVQPERPRKKS